VVAGVVSRRLSVAEQSGHHRIARWWWDNAFMVASSGSARYTACNINKGGARRCAAHAAWHARCRLLCTCPALSLHRLLPAFTGFFCCCTAYAFLLPLRERGWRGDACRRGMRRHKSDGDEQAAIPANVVVKQTSRVALKARPTMRSNITPLMRTDGSRWARRRRWRPNVAGIHLL